MIKIVINIKGIDVNYIKEGKGETVVILPGWGTTISVYSSLISSISKYNEVVCLDMPGFGESSEPKDIWDLDMYIDFVLEFIKKLNIKSLSFIGHSNGGRIILKLMSRHLPFEVKKIVLIGSAGVVHKAPLGRKLKVKIYKALKRIVLLKPVKKCFPTLLDKLQSKFGSADYKNASPILRGSMVKLINEDVTKYIPGITNPTILIWGDKDADTPIEDAYLIESLLKDGAVIKYEGASHYVFLERPIEVQNVIKAFLFRG